MHSAYSSECADWIATNGGCMNVMQEYKTWSDADKAALRDLRAEVAAKIGSEPKLGDMIAAVTPGVETPAYLKGL
jgi:hypothetical protein